MRDVIADITREWDSILHNQVRLEKGHIRMDEQSIQRDLKSKATMKIGDEWVTEFPPMRMAETLTGRPVCWVPNEVLPRFAKKLRDEMRMDVAVGNVAYYPYLSDARRQPGRHKYDWPINELNLSTMTMEVG